MDGSTPELSTSGSSAGSSRSSSAASSPLLPHGKALGLPKSRTASMSAGKIVVPGGKFKKASKAADDEE
ncbi:hypothetical protein BDR04DRAFT_1159206 [Suillus decipiens]|nr:hypothetical protein BDR04DRAFT_1159206 [Suillus decipiens]